jgi:putative nucleotidyltransferase with HDIG domain
MNQFDENKAVGRLTEIIALENGYTPAKAKQIKTAAVLHDIGKTMVPQDILNAPRKLTDEEFEIVKTHTKLGVEILSGIQGELGDTVRLVSLLHHEWHNPAKGGYWNISTYYLPDYISFVSIADVFTSLISRRPYKEPYTKKDALDYIENQAGTQFCPELVKMFTSLVRNDDRVSAIITAV